MDADIVAPVLHAQWLDTGFFLKHHILGVRFVLYYIHLFIFLIFFFKYRFSVLVCDAAFALYVFPSSPPILDISF